MADTITPILPTSPIYRATLDAPVGVVATSKIARITDGAAAGVEVNLQTMLRIVSVITREQRSDNANPDRIREFRDAPVTYDGSGNGRRMSPLDINRMFWLA
jgi:hypothetical protein